MINKNIFWLAYFMVMVIAGGAYIIDAIDKGRWNKILILVSLYVLFLPLLWYAKRKDKK